MSDKEREQIQQAQHVDTDRIFTLPNMLSFFRLLLIPLIVYLFETDQYWWAFGMLLLSGATDVIDGWIARTFHLVSDFGKALDPIADKLTQIAVLFCLMRQYWWVLAALLIKEVTIGILGLVALHRTHSVYSAGWYGKLCTVVIYLSMFVLILWQPVFGVPADPTFVLIDSIVIVALILLAFVKYLFYFLRILREARADDTRQAQ
ncbi:MAG: CDP-alcohol phosphatidyltransferase family protein [Clostridia bacterium]|nr:CDP-alcohol phosphatidyltransferase family protein [Oscillospiraceae bacterium]MBQ3763297.1 CDP-alcohol phosphatidyltransferase family protein [Clostridia bacterium]